jgi:dipeptidyl aminopeptidase/acylaminoacyl peptidase
MVSVLRGAVLALLAVLAMPARAQADSCGDELLAVGRSPEQHALTANDLIRLRDIGAVIGYADDPSPFAVSPDRHRVAFQIRQAEPDTNSYCLAMAVLDLAPGSRPRLVDIGGEMVRWTGTSRNLAHTPSGVALRITPIWSEDGQWIAYLRRDQGVTQIWRARADGSGAQAVTRSADDISTFRWSTDGQSILYATTGPSFRQAEQRIEDEGREGWIYDQRFWDLARAAPWPEAPLAASVFKVDFTSGQTVAATASEAASLTPKQLHPQATIEVVDDEAEAWVEPVDHQHYLAPGHLFAIRQSRVHACDDPHCIGGILQLWWLPGHREILYLRHEGWARSSQLALYRWRPGDGTKPVRILQTEDLLVGCLMAHGRLLCGRESAKQPREVVLINPASGHSQLLFDPNPDFPSHSLGSVQRLRWRNPRGKESFGDLVLPPHHLPGDHHPLIIVQYQSRGFLRGGTGDEYPIFLFAQHGFAVLSFDRTGFYGDDFPTADVTARTRLNVANWADRRDVLSALEGGIQQVNAMGVIDPHRIGITGLSDGSSTLQFALLHSHLFAAAATSTCCEDAVSSMSAVGPAYEQDLVRWGYPKRADSRSNFWRDYSLSDHASSMNIPLLMQLSDAEYRMGLESYQALASLNKPVEMRVFPGEFHNKWQPAHRAAFYRRSVEWFDFWLQGRLPDDPTDRARWCALSVRTSVRPSIGMPCG